MSRGASRKSLGKMSQKPKFKMAAGRLPGLSKITQNCNKLPDFHVFFVKIYVFGVKQYIKPYFKSIFYILFEKYTQKPLKMASAASGHYKTTSNCNKSTDFRVTFVTLYVFGVKEYSKTHSESIFYILFEKNTQKSQKPLKMAAGRLPEHYKTIQKCNQLTDFRAISVKTDVFEVNDYISLMFKCLSVFIIDLWVHMD